LAPPDYHTLACEPSRIKAGLAPILSSRSHISFQGIIVVEIAEMIDRSFQLIICEPISPLPNSTSETQR
jgi:hypothetical protein